MATYKGFTIKVDNKMREGVGETDFEKRIVRINKKRLKKRKEGEIGITLYHELKGHIDHPKAHEKTIYKREKQFKKLSEKQKQRLYNLL